MGLYCVVTILLVSMLLDERSHTFASGVGAEDASIPVLASGKRQHNIMRFGKRPAGGHSLIHFGKRDDVPPKHSFLYFGKREPVPDLLDYLQRARDGSYKRGHSIMRFGKRDGHHSFIRFGRDGPQEENDFEKRAGHSMMYFGKRGGSGHSMMYFGKRDYEDDLDDTGLEDKRAHAMIHFGKREDEDEEEQKRAAHSMIHFGKREEDEESEEQKRGGGAHSMIHFGKREDEDDSEDMEIAEAKRQAQHNLLRFGKKLDRKGSHAMIHFGKREVGVDKKAHAMIHFGKRSEDNGGLGNQSLNRMKREVDQTEPMVALVRYEDDIPARPSEELWSPLFHQDKDWEPDYMEYSQPEKKEGSNGSKNVFLRFG